MKIKRFEDLECWKESRKLVNMVYAVIKSSKAFQNDHRLKNQCTGAAISTMGNIPEGFVRRSNREFAQFLFVSISSAAELQSHFYVALDQKYINQTTFDRVYNQVER
ncbi:four helix bundle protein, partial [candidate division TA06 bacterium DG_78]